RQLLPLPRSRRRQRRQLHQLQPQQHRQSRQHRPDQRAFAEFRVAGRQCSPERQHGVLPRQRDGRGQLQDPQHPLRFRVGRRFEPDRRSRRDDSGLVTHAVDRIDACRRPLRFERLHAAPGADFLARTSAGYSSPDTCGAFGSPSTISGNPDQNSLATGCYKYTLTGTDNVGNTVSISTTVKVDTSDPSAPILTPTNAVGGAYHPGSGTRVYFRPNAGGGGGFDLGANSTDSDTDIASYTFPAGSALGTNWSS